MASIHPNDDILAAYAAGSLPDGVALLIAAHLTYCPHCRAAVAAYEDVGAAYLDEAEAAPLPDSRLDAIFAMIDDGDAEAETIMDWAPSPIPRPILDVAGRNFDDLTWTFRMPGLSECKLEGFDGEDVSLLRARPGTKMLSHTHKGEEATLILTGAMEDDGHVYKAGDVAFADTSHDHCPQIVGDETCYCLIVMSGGMHFTGRFSRALNLFAN